LDVDFEDVDFDDDFATDSDEEVVVLATFGVASSFAVSSASAASSSAANFARYASSSFIANCLSSSANLFFSFCSLFSCFFNDFSDSVNTVLLSFTCFCTALNSSIKTSCSSIFSIIVSCFSSTASRSTCDCSINSLSAFVIAETDDTRLMNSEKSFALKITSK